MHTMLFTRLSFAILIAAAGCNSPTSPNDASTVQPHGRLSGIVTIGREQCHHLAAAVQECLAFPAVCPGHA